MRSNFLATGTISGSEATEVKGGEYRVIYLEPDTIGSPNIGGRPIKVIPLSPTPTSPYGAGTFMVPLPNSRAVCVQSPDDETVYYLIGYIPTSGAIPSPTLKDGATATRIGGTDSVTVTHGMGYWSVGSGPSCKINIDAKLQKLVSNFKQIEEYFVGGFNVNKLVKKSPINPTSPDIHSYMSVHSPHVSYTDSLLGISHENFRSISAESLIPSLEVNTQGYKAKVIEQRGGIFDPSKIGIEQWNSHLYQLETRQNTIPPLLIPNVFTRIKLGEQDNKNIFEFAAEKFLGGLSTSMFTRFGQNTLGTEFYRRQLMSGLPTPVLDSPLIMEEPTIAASISFLEKVGITYKRAYQNTLSTIALSEEVAADGYNLQITQAGTLVCSINISGGDITISPAATRNIYLGERNFGNELVTKNWVTQIFANHLHPTPAGPTGIPVALTVPQSTVPLPTDFFTITTKAQ